MSLAIDVDTVIRVLLPDGWHDVANASFDLDAYEYLWSGQSGVSIADAQHDALVLHGGGQSGISATGFSFTDAATRQRMYGPLTAVLAVATDESKASSA